MQYDSAHARQPLCVAEEQVVCSPHVQNYRQTMALSQVKLKFESFPLAFFVVCATHRVRGVAVEVEAAFTDGRDPSARRRPSQFVGLVHDSELRVYAEGYEIGAGFSQCLYGGFEAAGFVDGSESEHPYASVHRGKTRFNREKVVCMEVGVDVHVDKINRPPAC